MGCMKVHLGATIAHCPECDSASFEFAHESQALREWPVLVCSSCGQTANYEDLITQIGAEAIKATMQALRRRAAQ
jgi:hypothetical protein